MPTTPGKTSAPEATSAHARHNRAVGIRTYAPVVDVEVVAGHQPLGAVEPEPRHPVRAVLPGRVEDPLELPRLPDRDHLGLAGPFRGVQVGPHHIQLPVALTEDHPRDVVAVRVPADRGPE